MTAVFVSLDWSKYQKYTFRSMIIFVLLFMLTLSEPSNYLPNWRRVTDPFFEYWVQWTATTFFKFKEPFIYQLTSDSMGSLIHVLHLIVVALIGGWIWGQIQQVINYKKIGNWFWSIIAYYLALQLFLYGFNKVFKCQFFLPEPNTLYTTVGETPKDLLFWTVMGASYGYTVFGGVLEVLSASLLLFRKTRLLGALLALGVMTNVVAINLGFNISVKFYASFLWLLAFLLILPYGRQLYAFFITNTLLKKEHWLSADNRQKKGTVMVLLKIVIIWMILFESLGPYFVANNFNDDQQQRPPFHGAYEVASFVENGMAYPPLVGYVFRWKRAFVHRRGYFIVQTMDDKMQDYHFRYDIEQQLFSLEHTGDGTTYYLNYTRPESTTLLLEGDLGEGVVQIRLEQLDLEKLPLLQDEFYWTIDAI